MRTIQRRQGSFQFTPGPDTVAGSNQPVCSGDYTSRLNRRPKPFDRCFGFSRLGREWIVVVDALIHLTRFRLARGFQALGQFEVPGRLRKLLTVPADRAEVSRLAQAYRNEALGDIAVKAEGGTAVFDFGEWRSEVASRRNPDGTISFVTVTPGVFGFEFVVGSGDRRTLTVRDAQHEYVFTEG